MVMVMGPTPPQDRAALSVAAVRGPGIEPGLLRSTTTQHDGFVNLVDVAPTVLTYFGLDRPDAMEGRRMETGDAGGSFADHRQFLVNVNEDGLFRDGLVGRHRGRALVDAASALAAGATCLSDIEAMTRQVEIFGPEGGASDTTMARVLQELSGRLNADGLGAAPGPGDGRSAGQRLVPDRGPPPWVAGGAGRRGGPDPPGPRGGPRPARSSSCGWTRP